MSTAQNWMDIQSQVECTIFSGEQTTVHTWPLIYTSLRTNAKKLQKKTTIITVFYTQ